MKVSDMTAQVYSILGLNSSSHPDLTSTVILGYLQEAHNKLAEVSKCYRRRAIISPILQAKATGTITISVTNVSDGDYVTINGTKYTFRTTPTLAFDVKIGTANTDTATNLTNAIKGTVDSVNVLSGTFANPFVTASVVTNVVTLTALLYGADGNAYTLVKSGAEISLSGAVMSGGVTGRYYNLPVDFCEMDNLYYGSFILKRGIMQNIFRDTVPNNNAGTPMYWFNYGALKFGVDTPPDGRRAFIAEMFVVPNTAIGVYPVLTSTPDAEPSGIEDRFCMVLVYDACIRALGTSVGDTIDGVQNRLAYCMAEKDRIQREFMGSLSTW